jgi:hypothetical protein
VMGASGETRGAALCAVHPTVKRVQRRSKETAS